VQPAQVTALTIASPTPQQMQQQPQQPQQFYQQYPTTSTNMQYQLQPPEYTDTMKDISANPVVVVE